MTRRQTNDAPIGASSRCNRALRNRPQRSADQGQAGPCTVTWELVPKPKLVTNVQVDVAGAPGQVAGTVNDDVIIAVVWPAPSVGAIGPLRPAPAPQLPLICALGIGAPVFVVNNRLIVPPGVVPGVACSTGLTGVGTTHAGFGGTPGGDPPAGVQ